MIQYWNIIKRNWKTQEKIVFESIFTEEGPCQAAYVRASFTLLDWISNLLIFPLYYKKRWRHAGYLLYAFYLKRKYKDKLKETDVLLGHSQGGSIASILSCLFEIPECYTFGSPGVSLRNSEDNSHSGVLGLVQEEDFVWKLLPFYGEIGERFCSSGNGKKGWEAHCDYSLAAAVFCKECDTLRLGRCLRCRKEKSI